MEFKDTRNMTWKSAIPFLIGNGFILFGLAGIWVSMTKPIAIALGSIIIGAAFYWIGNRNL
jgi:hypothetical protein